MPDPIIPEDTILTVTDAWAVGFCPSGLRRWFRSHPELDFHDFIKNGIRYGDLPHDDAGVLRIAAHKAESI